MKNITKQMFLPLKDEIKKHLNVKLTESLARIWASFLTCFGDSISSSELQKDCIKLRTFLACAKKKPISITLDDGETIDDLLAHLDINLTEEEVEERKK